MISLTIGTELLLDGDTGQTSNVESLVGTGAVEFIIATIATERFTRMA